MNARGTSPLVATFLLITIVLAAAVVTYAFITGFMPKTLPDDVRLTDTVFTPYNSTHILRTWCYFDYTHGEPFYINTFIPINGVGP